MSLFFNEGEQAEAYKAKKRKEIEDAHKADAKRDMRRAKRLGDKYSGIEHYKNTGNEATNKQVSSDGYRRSLANAAAEKMMYKTDRDMLHDAVRASDATNRHFRRHGGAELENAWMAEACEKLI